MYAELIEKLEKAESGSGYFDLDIWNNLHVIQMGGEWTAPAFTSSIDAAVALVKEKLPDCEWMIAKEYKYYEASVRNVKYETTDYFDVEHKSAPIALIIALLRALENDID